MIISRLAGGTGNQMFQYACGRALAIKNNTTLGLDLTYLLDRTPLPNFTFREYTLDIFAIEARIVSRGDIPFLYRKYNVGWAMRYVDYLRRKLVPTAGKETSHRFNPAILDLGPDTYLEGWWQSPKYFSTIEDVIRKDFTLKDPLSEKSQVLFDEIKNNHSVCVHVRRGDYVNNALHDVSLGNDYYEQGLQYIKKNGNVEKIYVFSDDIEWCKTNIHFDVDTMFVGPEYAGTKDREHVALMAGCRHFIIPNSSFSWWTAWLGTASDKIVIAPQRWFTDPSIDTSDLIPATWVRL